MKKILSLVLVLMFCVAAFAMAEPSIELVQIAPTVEGATFNVIPVDMATEQAAYEANREEYMGTFAAAKTVGMPLVAISKGILKPEDGVKAVKMNAAAPLGLKDGDKVVVAICIPGWDGDAIQGEIIDGQVVFELDEALLLALQSIPGFNGELLLVFFKGELPVEPAA